MRQIWGSVTEIRTVAIATITSKTAPIGARAPRRGPPAPPDRRARAGQVIVHVDCPAGRMAPKKKARAPTPHPPARRAQTKGFVGRDASPVLDKYPPKDPKLAPRGPPGGSNAVAPAPAPAMNSTAPTAAPVAPGPTSPTIPLITLERPFDVDEFSGLLGETSIRVTVPLEHLAEVFRRVTDFMGFGIYVYSVQVRPAASEFLKSFIVELQRVDYAAVQKDWVPFVEKGTSDSPFGPTGTRT
jgi:hypothetical protein